MTGLATEGDVYNTRVMRNSKLPNETEIVIVTRYLIPRATIKSSVNSVNSVNSAGCIAD